MSNIKLDIPNITVVVDKGDSYNVVVERSTIAPRLGTGSFIIVADAAVTASYALKAESLIAGGTIEYVNISASNDGYIGNNLTVGNNATIGGVVSASRFVTDGGVSTQFVKGDGTLDNNVYITADGVPSLPAYTVSSSTQIVESLPYGTISSSVQVVDYISDTNIAPNTVTSNAFVLNAGAVSLTFTGSVNTGIFGATEYVMPFIPTSSFCAATVEYVASRPGGVRVGVLLAGWSGSQSTATDVSSTDIGDTSDIRFSLVQNNGYIKLRVESLGSGSYPWTVQSLFKLFPTLV
jgi:hypothetical protein